MANEWNIHEWTRTVVNAKSCVFHHTLDQSVCWKDQIIAIMMKIDDQQCHIHLNMAMSKLVRRILTKSMWNASKTCVAIDQPASGYSKCFIFIQSTSDTLKSWILRLTIKIDTLICHIAIHEIVNRIQNLTKDRTTFEGCGGITSVEDIRMWIVDHRSWCDTISNHHNSDDAYEEQKIFQLENKMKK